MKRVAAIFLFLFVSFCHGQQVEPGSFSSELSKIAGLTFVKKENIYFKEYYEVTLEQLLDHADPGGKKFHQRFFIGYNGADLPTIMETDGYAIDRAEKSNYINEPASLVKGNMIIAEHRFFGKSVPDTLNWNYLTTAQASGDYHYIKTIFSALLKGKWMVTGISKGGQAALAYKMNFAKDADAAIIYSAPVKRGLYDERIKTFFKNKSVTTCGKKITAFQKRALQNKTMLLPLYENLMRQRKINPESMKTETMFEYTVLEYSFSFWQKGFQCEKIPDSTASLSEMLAELTETVPPFFYSASNLQKLQPAFYMAYHQLGYYEYDIAPFEKWLTEADYSNRRFAPAGCAFDNAYQDTLQKFIKSAGIKNVIFIYGESDPWAAAQPILNKKTTCLNFIAKGANHYCKISDLTAEQQKQVTAKLFQCIQTGK